MVFGLKLDEMLFIVILFLKLNFKMNMNMSVIIKAHFELDKKAEGHKAERNSGLKC